MLYFLINNANRQRKSNVFLLCLLLVMQTIVARGQLTQNNLYLNNEIKFERLAIENGLANNTAFGMTQDRKGFIWFGTLDALIKYDGYTLTRYQNNPQDSNSLGDNIVMSVFEDHTGLIWVGTAGGGGVNSFDPKTSEWKRYPHNPKLANSMGKGSIEGIAEDHNGMLWFGSTDGLTRYDPEKKHFTVFENNPNDKYSLSNNYIFSIKEDKAGMLWIGTGGGLNLFDPKNERFYLIDGDFSDSLMLRKSGIHHIYQDKQGLLWVSSYGGGLFVIDPVSKKCLAYYHHDPKNPNSLRSDIVYAVTQDLNGAYWVSTIKGLHHFNPRTKVFTLYQNNSYLPDTETKGHCIMTDRAGLVWIGTLNRGAIYFSPQQKNFRRYLNDEASMLFGAGSNRIKSIFKSADSQIYVATSQNLLRFNQAKDKFEELWQLKTIKRNNENFVLTAACEEKPGIFWLGTDKAGIIRYDSHTHKTLFLQNDLSDKESLANNWVNVLYRDRSAKLWVGTEGGDLQWYDSDTKKFIRFRYLSTDEEAPLQAGIRFIYEDSKGNFWIGVKAYFLGSGGNGVYHINRQTGNTIHYQHQPDVQSSLSNNAVTCFYEEGKGIYWIGTYAGGLNRLDAASGKITVYTKENGLLSNTVQGIAGDEAGNLWIKADEGIVLFNSTTLKTKQYGQADGLATSPVGVEVDDYNAYASLENKEGTIYFGSNNGLTVFNPGLIQENKFKPAVFITQFKVFDKSYPIDGKEFSLSYNQNFLDIEFAALSYLSSGKNQYAYKLEGVDKDWVNNGIRRIAHYTNVPPGKHVFQVKGSNNDGVWNEQVTTLSIIIHPPWWRAWWAYTLYVLLIISSIWAFIHYRSRNLIRQKRLLETQVVERTAEVVHQKQELQTTLEHLKSTQAQLIQSEKMASLGQLTAGIAHEIQNPLNFVNNFSEVTTELLDEAEALLAGQSGQGSRHEVPIVIGKNSTEVAELMNDIKQNLSKINHHGKRAEAIVKGMLEHSRSRSSVKEAADINILVDEYLRLSYQTMLAKNRTFMAVLKTDYDETIGKISIIPEDIGRVIFNVTNNAFYAVSAKSSAIALAKDEALATADAVREKEEEKQKQKTENRGDVMHDVPTMHGVPGSDKYQPEISVITKKNGSRIEITVRDNGNGIPEKIMDKIFQPFFTTKPTGQGTGLGLSLAYDIVKAHGGEIKVTSIEGQSSEFLIVLNAGS